MLCRLAVPLLLMTGLLPAATRAEAEAQVRRYINRRFALCEGDYLTTSFTTVRINGSETPARGVSAGNDAREYKGLRFTLKDAPLNTPDKLNGLTYKGGFLLEWDAVRIWSRSRSAWSPWSERLGTERATDAFSTFLNRLADQLAPTDISPDPSYPVFLAQLGGKWYFDGRPVEEFPATASCAEMPPVTAGKVADYVQRQNARAREEAAQAERRAHDQTCADFFRDAPRASGLNIRPVREDERLTGGLLVRDMDWAGCRSPNGDTPLLVAARYWYPRDAARVLNQAPAVASVRSVAGQSVSEIATERLRAGHKSMDRPTKAAWISFIKDTGGTPPPEVVLEPLRFDADAGEIRALLLNESRVFYRPDVVRGKWNREPVVVRITFLITASGDVDNIRIPSTNPPLAAREAATRALARWKFKPPQRNGEPAELKADINLKVYPTDPAN